MFRLILLPTVHVTKSSIALETRYAGSVIVTVPTRTCPYSTIFVAAWTVSTMCIRVMTTGSRRRANADTVVPYSTCDSFDLLARMPRSKSLSRSSCSCLRRTGLVGGRRLRRCASCRKHPQRRLYLSNLKASGSCNAEGLVRRDACCPMCR